MLGLLPSRGTFGSLTLRLVRVVVRAIRNPQGPGGKLRGGY